MYKLHPYISRTPNLEARILKNKDKQVQFQNTDTVIVISFHINYVFR